MNLTDSISEIPLVGPVYQRRLEKLRIKKVEDLLLHIPNRYEDYRKEADLANLRAGETATVHGAVTIARNQYTKTNKNIQLVEITNKSGKMMAVWFNQPFLIRSFRKNEEVALSGKVDWFGRKLALFSPEWEKIDDGEELIHTGRLVAIYPETAGVSSKWLRRRMAEVKKRIPKIKDYLNIDERNRLRVMELEKAIWGAHFPISPEEGERARERLAFDELLMLFAQNIIRKNKWKAIKPTFELALDKKSIIDFKEKLGFVLTGSQERAIEEILTDLTKSAPMNRLLQGDVGSGKTVVAAVASLTAFINGYQSAFMVPTQILAQQHFNTLNSLFERYKARVSLVTAEGIRGGVGKTDIYIGTHALIYKRIDLAETALIVIDEQHRFGVAQRELLAKLAEGRKKVPHILTMTATPIPRTVALTFYGDLELTVLTELPAGRKPITTWAVPPEKREAAYQWIAEQIKKEKVQAFVICPLIEESEVETMKQVKAATAEYQNIQKILPTVKIGLLHGKLKAKEKEEVVKKFRAGKIEILVATPVVEVGIDIENATIIVIEAAERFGLAQLHQLRGRVGRGKKKSYCLLFTEAVSDRIKNRLTALRQAKSGFELAEIDLKMRGPGEIFGLRQHGIAELKRANWQDVRLIKKAKKFAEEVFKEKNKHQKLLEYFEERKVAAN